MPRYLIQLSYTPEAWAAQVKHPQNRIEAVRPALEKVGGRFECAYYAFGPYDLIAIIEAPDNASAAAFALAVTAGGAVKSYVTTPLLTLEEGMTAMREAAQVAAAYQPPAS